MNLLDSKISDVTIENKVALTEDNRESLSEIFAMLLNHIETSVGTNNLSPENKIDTSNIADAFFLQNKFDEYTQQILSDELFALGPLQKLTDDPNYLEILVNSSQDIFAEHKTMGFIKCRPFLSKWSFERVFLEICRQSYCNVDLSKPEASGTFKNFRLQIISAPIVQGDATFSLRRIKTTPLLQNNLLESSWCRKSQLDTLLSWVKLKKNLIIIGPTGVGKTSVINFLLQSIDDERLVILEDSDEIVKPNDLSIKLLSREKSEHWRGYDFMDLLKLAMRLRPQRLVLGEIRGSEAKDFLLAMSCGHDGSITSLHSNDASHALKRLELLITLGAPQWDQKFVRELIFQTIHGIIWLDFNEQKRRCLRGLYELASNEAFGITMNEVC